MNANADRPERPRRGPNTAAGKATVSRNALRHGLRAVALVIAGVESQEDWDAFSLDVERSLHPHGAVETALADRVAELLWRIRRVARAEHDMLTAAQERDEAVALYEQSQPSVSQEARRAVKSTLYASALIPRPPRARLMPRGDQLQQLIRYEAHLNRQLFHALHELEALQARRSGNPAPLARIDIHGAPEE
jgi:hypothetical protein